MPDITYAKILVVGDNHEEIVKKYSFDTIEREKVEDVNDALISKINGEFNSKIINLLSNGEKILSKLEQVRLEEMLSLLDNLTDYEKVELYSRLNDYDIINNEDNGNIEIWRSHVKNPKYQYERCQQKRLEVTGEEGDFSDPFILNDGTTSYSAHYNDIDWDEMHMQSDWVDYYSRMWDVYKEGENATLFDDFNKRLYEIIKKRISYFENFTNKEMFVKHNCALWFYGIADKNKYKSVEQQNQIEWVANFMDSFIKPLEEKNPLLTIYEVKTLPFKDMFYEIKDIINLRQ